jgi:hypothetical protein
VLRCEGGKEVVACGEQHLVSERRIFDGSLMKTCIEVVVDAWGVFGMLPAM